MNTRPTKRPERALGPSPHPLPLLTVSYGVPQRGLPTQKQFSAWLQALLRGRRQPLEVALRIVAEDEGRALNLRHRRKDYATNVLSFPARTQPVNGYRFVGDIALCAPVIAREAAEQSKNVTHHFAHLFLHGCLHLLGYDHQAAADARRMERREIRTLRGLGIGNPYRGTNP